MKQLVKVYKESSFLALLFSIPLILLVALGFFVITDFKIYLKEIVAFSLLTTSMFFISLLFFKTNFKRFVSKTFILLLCLLLFIKVSFFILFNARVNASTLYIIFETNKAETIDFLDYYLNYKVFVLGVILIVLFYFISKCISEIIVNKSSLSLKSKFVFIVIITLCFYAINSRFSYENLIVKSILTYKDYSDIQAKLKTELAKPINTKFDVSNTLNVPRTYVVVIGESTTKEHMSLYDYYRPTNPLLTSIKKELLVFNDVISSNVHTIQALQKALTLSDIVKTHPNKNISIVQLANMAGFDTYWVSNQKPVGINETNVTLISNAAKQKEYLSSENFENEIYDENVLKSLTTILNDSSKNRLVFIHLMGTHSSYNKRYTQTFNVFNDKPKSEFELNAKAISRINHYDNAVLYNDYVIFNIIKKVKSKKLNSYVMYFSDHGEDVYCSSKTLLGHNEFYGTKPMYEVPFVFWQSEAYKLLHNNRYNQKSIINTPYILEDFIHSFSDISDIYFDSFEKEKSIFNNAFKIKKRLIKNQINYD